MNFFRTEAEHITFLSSGVLEALQSALSFDFAPHLRRIHNMIMKSRLSKIGKVKKTEDTKNDRCTILYTDLYFFSREIEYLVTVRSISTFPNSV